jgi:ATP-dependent Clp protease ATP-binding subunit ClpA
MTSNIGSREIMESLSEENQDIGDLYPIEPVLPSHSDEEVTQKKRNRRWKFKKETPITPAPDPIAQKREQLEEIVRPELLEFLRPEFLNRLDDNIIFNPISREMFKQILEIQLNQRKKQIAKTNGITLEFTHIAKNFLAKK